MEVTGGDVCHPGGLISQCSSATAHLMIHLCWKSLGFQQNFPGCDHSVDISCCSRSFIMRNNVSEASTSAGAEAVGPCSPCPRSF